MTLGRWYGNLHIMNAVKNAFYRYNVFHPNLFERVLCYCATLVFGDGGGEGGKKEASYINMQCQVNEHQHHLHHSSYFSAHTCSYGGTHGGAIMARWTIETAVLQIGGKVPGRETFHTQTYVHKCLHFYMLSTTYYML